MSANQGDGGRPDLDRPLGVIEAFTVVVRQCPNGAVRRCAEQALDAVRTGGPDALREQAAFVLSAIHGWRGQRAAQVHASLTAYLEQRRATPSTAKAASDPD